MYRLLISSASVLTLTVCSAHSQDTALETGGIALETITVIANRTPTELSKTGSTVERIDQEEIERASLPQIRDYLNLLPGISLTANGGMGTSSNLYIRGLPGAYIKTLYNGIDVSDVTGTQVQTQYQYLLSSSVTGIEVLKGSQSTLYGSNAIAGLVDISTLGDIKDGVNHTVEAEGGSFGTARGRYGFTAAKDGSRISGNISGLYTDGISALAGGTERDGYRNVTLDIAAEHRINDAFSVFGSLLYVDAKTEFDNYGPNDSTTHELAKMTGGRAGFNLDLLDGRLKNTFSAQGFKSDRDSVSGNSTSSFVGTRQTFDYHGSFEVTDRILLQYGLDHERQEAKDAGGGSPLGKIDTTGFWAQSVFEPINNLTLTAGVRHDEHSMFGGHTTWRGTASYLFEQTGTRLHASYGTGFRAPSLYELYGPADTGNPNLRPETSKSFDVGIGQSFLDGKLTTDLTYFHIKIDNRIGWVDNPSYPWWGYYDQVPGRTTSQGVEIAVNYAATHWLNLAASYTYTHAKEPTGARRSNVPVHMGVLSATAKPTEKWTISGDLKFVSDVVDRAGKLEDYVLLNAKVAYQVSDSTEIYLRGENLLDQHYEVVRGYNTPGVAAYAGIRAKF